jgi:prepilin-type processing-associated H-X9-DG protein
MKEIEARIIIDDCPMEKGMVDMSFCVTCEYYKDTSFRHGNVFYTDGHVDCKFDEEKRDED